MFPRGSGLAEIQRTSQAVRGEAGTALAEPACLLRAELGHMGPHSPEYSQKTQGLAGRTGKFFLYQSSC